MYAWHAAASSIPQQAQDRESTQPAGQNLNLANSGKKISTGDNSSYQQDNREKESLPTLTELPQVHPGVVRGGRAAAGL